MGKLMHHYLCHSNETTSGGIIRIDEQSVLPECDAVHILHGTDREVRQCHQIDFLTRIGYTEKLFIEGDGEGSALQGEVRKAQITALRPYSYVDSIDR